MKSSSGTSGFFTSVRKTFNSESIRESEGANQNLASLVKLNSCPPNFENEDEGRVSQPRKSSLWQQSKVYVKRKFSYVLVEVAGIGHSKEGNTITLGLVVHSAFDGLVIGAATQSPELHWIVIIAIIAHKAPAAFGLTAVLIKASGKKATGELASATKPGTGLDNKWKGISDSVKKQISKNLLIFSLAAPVGAIATFLFIQIIGESVQGYTGDVIPTICLLFSAGTFLYIATVHVLPEVGGGKRLGSLSILLICVGAVLPALFNLVGDQHAHSHSAGCEGEHHIDHDLAH